MLQNLQTGNVSSVGLFEEMPLTGRLKHETGLEFYVRSTGAGPTTLVVGGTHGDEFEGQIAVSELAAKLDQLPLMGRVICLPFHNPGACRTGTRVDAVDQLDLNRQYVTPNLQTETGRIADFMLRDVLPNVDVLIDLHSGGKVFEFVPSGNVQARIGSREDLEMREWLRIFGAPFGIVFDDIGTDEMPHAGTLEAAARNLGAKAFSSELGGAGRVHPNTMAVARQGLLNLLAHVGNLPRDFISPSEPPLLMRLDAPEHNILVDRPGLLEPRLPLGTRLKKGNLIAKVHREHETEDVRATCDGWLAAWQIPTTFDPTVPVAMVCPPLT